MWHLIIHFWWWFQKVTGTDNTAGRPYGFWSGFGSDIGEITLLATIIAWWKAGECHVDKCHRRGKHPFKSFKLCRHHHPDVPDKLTHLHIKQLHKRDSM